MPDTAATSNRVGDDAGQRRRVLQIARRLSATLGIDFIHSLVKNLAEVLNVDCAYVGELCTPPSDRIRAISLIRDGEVLPWFEQTLTGTASGQVMGDGAFAYSRDVRRIFPDDRFLLEIEAEGFAGIRLSDSAGQPLGMIAIVSKRPLTDVQLARSVLATFAPRASGEIERKRNEDLRRENEERYHAFVASNPDAMWRLEFRPPVPVDQPPEKLIEQLYSSGYLAECNDALARNYGREKAEELVNVPFEMLVPSTDERLQEDLRSLIRDGFRASVSERVISDEAGRQQYRLRSQFGIVEDGCLRRIWGNTRDITDLRRAELSAAAAQRRFREVLEGIRLPAFMLNSHGTIVFCNQFFGELAQRSESELRELVWMNGIIPAEEVETWKAAVSAAGTPDPALHFEGQILPREETRRLILWDTIRLRNQHGEVSMLAAIGRDITYERALETQVRQAQKLDGIARLAAGIAHDFNNLLTVILGHAALLLTQVTEADRAQKNLLEIVNAANVCTKLTQQLVAFGRKQPLKLQLIDMNVVIADAQRLIRSVLGEEIMLEIAQAASLPLVLADPTQMQQVLVNLSANARDAMTRGGTLTIATAAIEIREEDAEHPGLPPGTYVRVSVSDNGSGISDEILAHIFEPFFTTKEPGKGTGLGLSIVYGIVTQSGGHISVRSERGRGTTFEILLPAPPPVVH